MAEDWQNGAMGGAYFEGEVQDPSLELTDPSGVQGAPYYMGGGFRGYNSVALESRLQVPTTVQGYMDPNSRSIQFLPQLGGGFPPMAYSSGMTRPETQGMFYAHSEGGVPNGMGVIGSSSMALDHQASPSTQTSQAASSGVKFEDEDAEASLRKSKKRKLGGSLKHTHEKPKRSILEEMLIILDEGTHGISWCLKIDTEGDVQDGMQIYNETVLERTLEDRRGVTGYGLSKHLAKDLRYYGFVYDRETKVFWNEDHKHPLTHRSYWQKDERTRCLQLKRMTSEPERNLSRLSSLMKNVQLAELLKLPEHSSVCPPPSKYIILSELHTVFPHCLSSDAHNIKLLLAHYAINDVMKLQWDQGNVPTKAFDHLMTRLGTTTPDFIADLRDFVAGAARWYHGVMERDEAVTLLQGQPEGTFLIRESTQSDCYSLSWVKADPMQQLLLVNHMRVEQTNAGFAVHGDEAPTRTLVQWISNHSAYLKHPLSSPRYCMLSVVPTAEKRLYSMTEGQLPANYMRGFPSRMETSNPSSPSPF